MNESTSTARAVVDELIRGGTTDVVLAPGSRSAALALALAQAERAGHITLHVRLDERSAGYLALGIAKVQRRPVAVVTTSGTAAVNLHPAIVEASYSAVPLIAVTADRPPTLRAAGANQTIEQQHLFGGSVRWYVQVDVSDALHVRSIVARALAVARDEQHPGPVHLNVPFADPLVPSADDSGEIPGGRAGRLPWVRDRRGRVAPDGVLQDHVGDVPVTRGVIVVGDHDDSSVPHLVRNLAGAMGWPVISEPSGNCTHLPQSLRHGSLILDDDEFLVAHSPDIVLTIGRVGLHRSVARLIALSRTHVAVDPRPLSALSDPSRSAGVVLSEVPLASGAHRDPEWLEEWVNADNSVATIVNNALDNANSFTGPTAIREVTRGLHPDDLVVCGPSWPVRHLSTFAGSIRSRVIGNRGTSGIDGIVSMAWGSAHAHGQQLNDALTICVLGDLTALYDRNGLLAGAGERHPNLVYVVIDNNGGGIFSVLEQSAPEFAVDFERVFGTPHGTDIAASLIAPGVTVVEVHDVASLADALAASRAAGGVHVVVARVESREVEAQQIRHIAGSL
ncbi:MAG: 2-succinyl-5-enolpyruvyl-6-hydroxy-3-cyclohexene-1-carboxylic-acid synthase [Actinobacteria bacterium]|nr:2-succinyl-5-enolpyruvyl-6-hydroxy-3-cyclohexene-1-carboxylic-acid synthase [Actinomycetota bacterium]